MTAHTTKGSTSNRGGTYQIDNSLMFARGAPSYFSKTPTAGGNDDKWTLSVWAKQSNRPDGHTLLHAGTTANDYTAIHLKRFDEGMLEIFQKTSTVEKIVHTADGYWRDSSAWTHVLVSVDTSLSTNTDRVKLWIDGIRQQVNDNTKTLDTSTFVLDNVQHWIGDSPVSASMKWDGYLAEHILLDGVHVTDPNDFGEFHPDNEKLWRPIDPSDIVATGGSKSWWLDFKDGTSATTLGYDVSGNANHFTPSGIGTDHQSTDTPTNNVMTINTLGDWNSDTSNTFTEGNRNFYRDEGGRTHYPCTFNIPDGKWYWEWELVAASVKNYMLTVAAHNGWIDSDSDGGNGETWAFRIDGLTIEKKHDGTTTNISTTAGLGTTVGTVWGIAIEKVGDDIDIWFSQNNTWQEGSPSAGTGASFTDTITTLFVSPSIENGGSLANQEVRLNAAAADLAYTPPTGFSTLEAQNMPTPTVLDGETGCHSLEYTGNGGSTRVLQFKAPPAWISAKNYDVADGWANGRRNRGNYYMSWDSTAVETNDTTCLKAFSTVNKQVSVGTNHRVNANTEDYQMTVWAEDASIGQDVINYTGNGVAGRTISHANGVIPEVVIVKKETNDTEEWIVLHKGNGGANWLLETLYLDQSAQSVYDATGARWNNTAPTATNVTIGSHTDVNENTDTYQMVIMNSVEGYSAFGSYTGNGSATDGPFLHFGFRPAVIMLKRTDATGSWTFLTRDMGTGYNPRNQVIYPDGTNVLTATDRGDIVDNGFKFRTTSTWSNAAAGAFIYMAWADIPFFLKNNGAI